MLNLETDLIPLGALPAAEAVHFRTWAPKARQVEIVLEPDGRAIPMDRDEHGYHTSAVPGLQAGARYRYRLDGDHLFPDPASRFQPEGVHGPSEVVDPAAYRWQDADWAGVPQERHVIYELHVGTFTPEGTFAGLRARLPYLQALGVTVIELMPIADWPGRWNWGYDHAALYAPSRAYGTPDDLRALVDAAHAHGMAVFLDVIYNHLGPDGAYLAAFGPLFTEKHHTPWGQAINLDDARSDGVRNLFIDNALHWLREYHLDGLRLDATDCLKDDSDPHFLEALATAVHALDGPHRYLYAEDHRNENRLIRPRSEGGYGLDGVWADNFHHQVRNLTAGDHESYFADFAATTAADLAVTLRQGWFYDHERVSPTMGQPRGTDPSGIQPMQCVICIQNHDQVGNRALGNRLTDDVPPPVYRAASALLLFAPETPLLFMGQEWGAATPFLFFTDHNEDLGRLVREGRKEEFRHFTSFGGEVPDPQDPDTFRRSCLRWEEQTQPPHRGFLQLYRDLLRLRADLRGPTAATAHGDRTLHVRRGRHHLLLALEAGATLPRPAGAAPLLSTEDDAYAIVGQPPEVRGADVFFPVPAALVLAADAPRAVSER